MTKKKDRAYFTCPRWSDVANAPGLDINPKVLAAIKNGQPVARSTLRAALAAARTASGVSFDIDAYIVDRRTGTSRP